MKTERFGLCILYTNLYRTSWFAGTFVQKRSSLLVTFYPLFKMVFGFVLKIHGWDFCLKCILYVGQVNCPLKRPVTNQTGYITLMSWLLTKNYKPFNTGEIVLYIQSAIQYEPEKYTSYCFQFIRMKIAASFLPNGAHSTNPKGPLATPLSLYPR